MRTSLIITLAFLSFTLISCSGKKEDKLSLQDRNSPLFTSMTNIGNTHVHIEFNAPNVNGRKIFGELVPFDKVWTTGIPKVTTLQLYNNVTLNGQPVAAGKYGIYTIPGEKEWTVMLNWDTESLYGSEYPAESEVMRFTVKPEPLPNVQERLRFEVKQTDQKQGFIAIEWEKTRISFEVTEQ